MSDLHACMEWGLEDYKLKQEHNKLPCKPRSNLSTSSKQDDSAEEVMSAKMVGKWLENLSLYEKLTSEQEKLGLRICALRTKYSTIREYHQIPPRCPNFLHVALLTLEPECAEDAFIYFGIELRCVDGLEKIYDIEGLSKKDFIPREKFDVSNVAKITTEFIKTMLQAYSVCDECDKSQPIIERIATSVYAFKNAQIKKFKQKLKECNSDLANAFMKRLLCLAPTFETEISTEAQLHEFIQYYMLLDTTEDVNCTAMPMSRSLPQFRWMIGDDSVGQQCTTDLEYSLEEMGMNKNGNENCPIEVNVNEELVMAIEEDTLSIDANLLLQCWKQAYAAAISRVYSQGQTKYVVLQGCTIILGEWVRNCVICICMEDYTELKKIDNAMKMVEWIKARAETGYAWCRFYVHTQKDNLLDVNHLQKYFYTNFCTFVDRN